MREIVSVLPRCGGILRARFLQPPLQIRATSLEVLSNEASEVLIGHYGQPTARCGCGYSVRYGIPCLEIGSTDPAGRQRDRGRRLHPHQGCAQRSASAGPRQAAGEGKLAAAKQIAAQRATGSAMKACKRFSAHG
jgi:hypothetical protein